PSCIDCHKAHQFRPAEASTCLACHGDASFVAQHVEGEDLERVLAYENSIHGEMTECADCHEGHLVFPTDDPRSVVSRMNVSATCAECHAEVAEHYERSEHAKALATNFAQAPACTDCHGEHNIREVSDVESPMSRPREVQVCLDCHLDSPEVQERMTHTKAFVASYEWSVHGRAAASGNLEAAICSDCHGAHDAMKASNPEALINKFNIAETCGGCHEEIKVKFDQSIHGVALTDGLSDAPTCTTCHSEHEILKTADSQSPVALINVSEDVCAPCHESFKLSEKYGFPSDRTTSFSDSYHGLAGRFGSAESANCASCHGVHDIHPSSDPRTTVHPANLEATCGSCHPGANANFAKGSVHVIRTPEGDSVLYWIGTIYLGVIILTVGGMSLHNVLDWYRKTKVRYRQHSHPVVHPISEDRRTGLYVRMTLNERIQHALLASSFMLLVISGFMLKFPDAWWVLWLRDVVGESLFDLRGLLHRIAAVVMVADSFYHIYYVAFTQRGRRFISDILFRKSDFREMAQMIRFNLGLTTHRPRFDRFNYIEKSEYWALIWGTIVMTVTGVVLWFENHFMGEYSKLFVDINETIHYYEAWLAFLAIVVWHFYYVIFNPDVYPLNFTFITGKMTEHEMAHEHPVELERIKDQEAATSGGDKDG
ncbi:MAG TPA: cytochrome c3 family protein, partial [Rhodothermia bacterium]